MGKVSSKFDFNIDSNPTEIKSQQPYRTSPRKRKMIHEAIKKLKELDVIEPATANNIQIAKAGCPAKSKGKYMMKIEHPRRIVHRNLSLHNCFSSSFVFPLFLSFLPFFSLSF